MEDKDRRRVISRDRTKVGADSNKADIMDKAEEGTNPSIIDEGEGKVVRGMDTKHFTRRRWRTSIRAVLTASPDTVWRPAVVNQGASFLWRKYDTQILAHLMECCPRSLI